MILPTLKLLMLFLFESDHSHFLAMRRALNFLLKIGTVLCPTIHF